MKYHFNTSFIPVTRKFRRLLIISLLFCAIWAINKRSGTVNFIANTRNKTPRIQGRMDEMILSKSLTGPILKHNGSKALVKMIEEILTSDTSSKGDLQPEIPEVPDCAGKPTMYHNVEDILCMNPPVFSPKYKNPCWFTQNDHFRCLPYFQLIGMDKCGSTDLFDRIAEHPSVLHNTGMLGKETAWWPWLRYGQWFNEQHPIYTFENYSDFFSAAGSKIRNHTEGDLVTGDGTPMDLWDNSGWIHISQNEGLNEPKFLTPHLIRHVNPDVKLLVILRDPVERLFSDYVFHKLGPLTTSCFHLEVVRSIQNIHNCTRQNTLRSCLYDRQQHVKARARIHLGFYSIFLQDWFRVFPRQQFLILRTEDFALDIAGHLDKIFQFLELRNLSKPEVDEIVERKRKYVTQRKSKMGNMLPLTRAILNAFYSNPNRDLSYILHDDKYLWSES